MSKGNNHLSISLKACRINANLRQSDLAIILGVCTDTIKNWEKGDTIPNFIQLQKISEITRIPVECIFLPNDSTIVEKQNIGGH